MSNKKVISIVLNSHLPFVRHPEMPFVYEETPFYSAISETFLPLLKTMENLEADSVPFKLALVISPSMCHMLKDDVLIQRYFSWLDRQIEFGHDEVNRTKKDSELLQLTEFYRDRAINNKKVFAEKYNGNIPGAFASFQKKGFLELVLTPATNCFLPFIKNNTCALDALLQTAIISHNLCFRKDSSGIYLPELGWHSDLDQHLQNNNFKWSIIEPHGAFLANPPAKYGSFYPVKTKLGTNLLIKDYYAYTDIMDKEMGIPFDPSFRDFYNDAVDTLPKNDVKLFLNSKGIRIPTGFKYSTMGNHKEPKTTYNRQKAWEQAIAMSKTFLDRRLNALSKALIEMQKESVNDSSAATKNLISLCTWDADFFGRFWFEGPVFLENIFRFGAKDDSLVFMTPSEYLAGEDKNNFQTIDPCASSSCFNGYAENLIDANNDWSYRHISQALLRMTELADRFKNETGIRARCLNQAAREILLAISLDWTRLMSENHTAMLPKWRSYAQKRLEDHLRNFTTIYESLGSSYLNTRFLTEIEQRNNIFPNINYRVFRRNHAN
ncbi:MAG: glycoside hydrolase family 57 protein [Termitinemataceae bacterium]|nr:MAG: glycoside hydrolase family 57 protein [Termitinemataceae bacterium]